LNRVRDLVATSILVLASSSRSSSKLFNLANASNLVPMCWFYSYTDDLHRCLVMAPPREAELDLAVIEHTISDLAGDEASLFKTKQSPVN
jgi:hypothetical protein